MNSHNYEGANTITKSESEIQYFANYHQQRGQNVQNFGNNSGFQMNSYYNNPEGGADTNIRNRIVFADTRSASDIQYFADYNQLGPNFQNVNNRINSEFQVNSNNYSKAGENYQEAKNEENIYSLPFDQIVDQKSPENENSLKEKNKSVENLLFLVAIFALILILIGLNIILYWDYTSKYKELAHNQENLAVKVENYIAKPQNLNIKTNQGISATDENLTDKYEDLTSKLLTMENYLKIDS